jgi:hypothetical protein
VINEPPITPPPELVQQWIQQSTTTECTASQVATRAAQWGADQELEACCEWLEDNPNGWVAFSATEFAAKLRAARRPKPSSMKALAMDELDGIAAVFRMSHGGDLVCDKIRRALEALDD